MQHLVHILEATTGGTRRHLNDVVMGLDPARFRQTVIASPLRNPDFLNDVATFRAHGVEVHLVPMPRSPLMPWRDLSALRRILRILDKARPHIVHTHSSKAGALGRVAARLARIPRVIHTPHVFASEMDLPRPLRLAAKHTEMLLAKLTTSIICVSADELRVATRLGLASHARLIYNGVPPPAASPAPPAWRAPLRIALIGRPCHQKGQDLLLEALRQAPELAAQHRFELVGVDSPAELPRHVRPVAESGLCHLLPPLPPHEVMNYLKTVDLVIMPSRWEGLPYSLLEAMSLARPVLATAVGGVPEVIKDGINGWLAPPNDPAALALRIRRVCADRDTALRCAAAAVETVRQHFGIDTMLSQLSEIYEETNPP